MKKRIISNLREENGASATIEFILLTLILFAIMVTVLDFGLYFNNRFIVSNATQNGARLVAIYGGTDDTPILKKYGTKNITPTCTQLMDGKPNAPGCQIVNELEHSKGKVNIKVHSVSCSPELTSSIGEITSCTVTWEYRGIPGSALSLVKGFKNNVTRLTSESEVVTKR